MTHSEKLNELAAALAAAQGEIEAARKDASNPFFRSRYADLASCWDACRDQLSKHGLAVIQTPTVKHESLQEPLEVKRDHDKPPKLIWRWQYVTVETLLVHSSGQYVQDSITLVCSDDTPQGAGSAITYARRYALSAMVGIAPADDDDGNGASQSVQRPPQKKPQPTPPKKADDVAQEPPDYQWVEDYESQIAKAEMESEIASAEFNARGHFQKLGPQQIAPIEERLKGIKAAKESKRKQFIVTELVTTYGQDAYATACGGKALDELTLQEVQQIAQRLKGEPW